MTRRHTSRCLPAVARRAVALSGALLLAGCPPAPTPTSDEDGGLAQDAGPSPDGASRPDAATVDAAPLRDASPGTDAARPDANVVADGGSPADAAPPRDAALPDATIPSSDAGRQPWQTSFSSCWNTSTCRRALLLSHGGDWGGAVPYGSHAAHVRALENGADAVKVDVRTTADGVPMVVHSSPFEIWETLDCNGERVEEMTAEEAGGCHMLPSATERFPRLDETIAWARGRINLMFTVKESRDFASAIQLATDLQALDFVLLEVGPQDITTHLPPIPGWDQFFYDVQLSSLTELDSFLALSFPAGVVAVALDLNEFSEPEADITAAINDKVLPRGLHALTPSDKYVATVEDHLRRWNLGYDVLYTYNLPNGVIARPQVNTARGVTPP